MTLRSLVRQALAALSGIRREQLRQRELLEKLLDEVRGPYPTGSVTIDVGPVSEIPIAGPRAIDRSAT
jgi:hypothetical protein